MGLFERLERALERLIEGRLLGGFRGRAHPVEIARALTRRMQADRRIGVEHVYVPNVFEVGLNPTDYASLEPIAREVEAEIVTILERQVKQRDYALAGPLQVRLEAQDTAAEGAFEVQARFERGEGEEVSPTLELGFPAAVREAASRAESVRHDLPRARAVLLGSSGFARGRVYSLASDHLVIGRSSACLVHIPDAQVSKTHGHLDWNGTTYVLTPTGRNETRVNGIPLTGPVALGHGDQIVMGASTICYRFQPVVGETADGGRR